MERNVNEGEYIYISVPVEYIGTYNRLLGLMADFGEDMLKDCKASCTDRNSNVIDCFNMFGAAVAAKQIGKTKLANTIIKYIDAKITQIYGGYIDDVDPTPEPPQPIGGKYWYVGQITRTRSQFANLSVNELLKVSTQYPAEAKRATFDITESCWFIIIRDDMDVQSAGYCTGGIDTTFTKEDIKNGFKNNTRHDDIYIDGILHHVYVNRNEALIDSDSSGLFIIE